VLALPLYWIFGSSKFHGYVAARRTEDIELGRVAGDLMRFVPEHEPDFEALESDLRVLESLAEMPFTGRNDVQLLVDGREVFDSLFSGIEAARDYVLVQFYIVRDDTIGRELKDLLARRAREGVRVYFLFDAIGSHKLPDKYIDELRSAGVEIHGFRTTKGPSNRFQLNFRNHRKIVVVDGRAAFVGGVNVGDEYLGRDPSIGPWRDTGVKVEGPAVQCIQVSFIEDWYWVTHRVPGLNWVPEPAAASDKKVLVIPSGPADEMETCGLFFVHAINAARRRIWIASPYFVPDSKVISALQLAAMRGVDVRIIIPDKPDLTLMWLSSFSYLGETEGAGVKIYRYEPGFLHHKVMLVDDFAAVGTANLDNRSFRINFEIILVVVDAAFSGEVESMFADDLEGCRPATAADYRDRPFWFKLAVRVARLLSPIQ
jgi:cardiolipin synthase